MKNTLPSYILFSFREKEANIFSIHHMLQKKTIQKYVGFSQKNQTNSNGLNTKLENYLFLTGFSPILTLFQFSKHICKAHNLMLISVYLLHKIKSVKARKKI